VILCLSSRWEVGGAICRRYCLVLRFCVQILDKLYAKVRYVFVEVQEHSRPFNLASLEVQTHHRDGVCSYFLM